VAIKKKVIKGKAPKSVVTRKISVPAGTREILIHVTIGRKGHAVKMMKSGIEDDPGGGGD
jgi:regulator of extracellular matrix RemA (YlzA/DUF370 family)